MQAVLSEPQSTSHGPIQNTINQVVTQMDLAMAQIHSL